MTFTDNLFGIFEFAWWIILSITGSIQFLLAARIVSINTRRTKEQEWELVITLIYPIASLLRAFLPRLELEGFYYILSIASILVYVADGWLTFALFDIATRNAVEYDREAANIFAAIVIVTLILADILGWFATITTFIVIPVIAEALWVISVAFLLLLFYVFRERSEL